MLYERARAALVAQLRSVDPPLEEADVTRERLALEEAIRKAEAEAAAKARPPAAPPPPREPASSLRDQGLRNFRDTVAEAGDLGDAAAEANRRRAHSERHAGRSSAGRARRAHALFRAATPGGGHRPKRRAAPQRGAAAAVRGG